MAVRTLEQIISELSSVYNPQIESVRQQQALIPQQIQDDEKQLTARQGQAFDQILGGARQRGLGFSGIPLAEQAKYTSTEFLPALARSRQEGRKQTLALEDAILGIYERRNSTANQLRQFETQQDMAEREFAEGTRRWNLSRDDQLRQQAEARLAAARAASSGGWASALGGGGSAPQASKGTSLQSYLAKQYAANPAANRATQDSWVRAYAKTYGANANDPALWAAYNTLYPWEKYSDQARKVPASSVPGSNKIPIFNTSLPNYANPAGLRY